MYACMHACMHACMSILIISICMNHRYAWIIWWWKHIRICRILVKTKVSTFRQLSRDGLPNRGIVFVLLCEYEYTRECVCVCVCVCLSVGERVCVCVREWIWVRTWVSEWVSEWERKCVCVRVCAWVSEWVSEWVSVWVSVSVYAGSRMMPLLAA